MKDFSLTNAHRRPVVAAFDFDGTLTREDSLFRFLMHAVPLGRLASALAAQAPMLVAARMQSARRGAAKEALMGQLFAGVTSHELRELGKDFAGKRLESLMWEPMVACVEAHKARGHRCVLVSASFDFYLEPWAEKTGLFGREDLICTTLEFDGYERFTGRFRGENCNGAEKSRRLTAYLAGHFDTPRDQVFLHAYGNSSGDARMLAMADRGIYVTRSLRKSADDEYFVRRLIELEAA